MIKFYFLLNLPLFVDTALFLCAIGCEFLCVGYFLCFIDKNSLMSLSKHVHIKITVKKVRSSILTQEGVDYCRCFVLCNKWTHHHHKSLVSSLRVYVCVHYMKVICWSLLLKTVLTYCKKLIRSKYQKNWYSDLAVQGRYTLSCWWWERVQNTKCWIQT